MEIVHSVATIAVVPPRERRVDCQVLLLARFSEAMVQWGNCQLVVKPWKQFS